MAKQYRSLENQGAETRKDDILRAAVSAFVALTQPSKRDCNQIEDLALSILPYASDSTKRFIAAALANSRSAPNALVRRLCEEPGEICAPLLLRSPVLTPLDLTVMVGTKSREHARIISKREHLPNTVIEALALLDDPIAQARVTYGNAYTVAELNTKNASNLKPLSAADARERLREIMVATFEGPKSEVTAQVERVADNAAPASNVPGRDQLLKLALHDQEGLFVTALSDLSGLPFTSVLKLTRRKSPSELSTLLRAYGVDANSAFVMCSIFYPAIASNRSEIRLFLERHAKLDTESAKDMVRAWKADEISVTFSKRAANLSTPVQEEADTETDIVDWEALFKAS
ncbi:MAG: hypothetical protein ACRCU5_00740 [Rhizobiaceae bacterium]